jgi:hypothetical protein
MKYLLLIYHDEQNFAARSEEQKQEMYGEYRQLREDLQGKKQFVDGSQLTPSSTATCVRVRDGKPLITDGPFAETKEQLGGYFLVDAESLDQAMDIAKRIPSARMGTIEVRALI